MLESRNLEIKVQMFLLSKVVGSFVERPVVLPLVRIAILVATAVGSSVMEVCQDWGLANGHSDACSGKQWCKCAKVEVRNCTTKTANEAVAIAIECNPGGMYY